MQDQRMLWGRGLPGPLQGLNAATPNTMAKHSRSPAQGVLARIGAYCSHVRRLWGAAWPSSSARCCSWESIF